MSREAVVPRWEPQPWRQHAACKGMNPDLFFPSRGESSREAKATCRSCTVRTECLEHAIAADIRNGVWGGESERARRRIRSERRTPEGMKRCGSCRVLKGVAEFGRQTQRPDGLNPSCKQCRRRVQSKSYLRRVS